MRILFVCFADSSHSQSWINLFSGVDADIRVFAGPFFVGGMYPPIPWSRPTYVLSEPQVDRGAKTISLFSKSRLADVVSRRIVHRLSLDQRFFVRSVSKWKPDIVHALSLNPAAVFAWEGLQKIPASLRPKFVASSWGSDIYLGKDDPDERPKLEKMLENCDGFFGDCHRDIANALSLGLKSTAAFEKPVPVNGGIDFRSLENGNHRQRNVILIPKAYESVANKTLPILEALEMLRDKLDGWEVHLLMASAEVRRYLATLSDRLKARCTCYSYLPNDQVSSLMRRSKVMIAPSISDGTPISLLEAMANGVLPIVSPVESIQEWITDGENGLLVNALFPDQIARAVERGLSDDVFAERASAINFAIVNTRANRDQIRQEVMVYYANLLEINSR